MLWVLDATTESLQAKQDTGTDVKFTAHFADKTSTTFVPANNYGSLTTSYADIVAAPAASTQRPIRCVTFYNSGVSTRYVSVQLLNSGTGYEICTTVAIQPLGTLLVDQNGINTVSASPYSIGNLTQSDLALDDYFRFYDTSAGFDEKILSSYLLGFSIDEPGLRLSGTTGNPVPATDPGAGLGTVYYTFYNHNRIKLYDGTRWIQYNLAAELSNDLSASSTNKAGPAAVASGSNYDLFVWDDSGTVRLTRGPAWSSDTSRGAGAGTSELERVNGVLVNKQAITNGPAAQRGRYVGSIRGTASNQTTDSAAKRFIWNAYNQVQRRLFYGEENAGGSATSITGLTGTTLAVVTGSAAFTVEVLTGLDGVGVDLTGVITCSNGTANTSAFLGIGVGGATATPVISVISTPNTSSNNNGTASHCDQKAAGYQIYYLSYCVGSGTGAILKDAGGTAGEGYSGDPYSTYIKGTLNA